MGAYWILGVFATALLVIGFWRAERAFRTLRGMRVVTCPETRQRAAVALNGPHAVWTAILGTPDLRVHGCSRWPDRRECDQGCIREVRQAPAKTRVQTILADWCRYNACACCGAPLAKLDVGPHRPHLMSRDLRIFEWREIPLPEIPETLRTVEPVCDTCLVAETHTW